MAFSQKEKCTRLNKLSIAVIDIKNYVSSCGQPWVDLYGQPLLSEIFFSIFRKQEGKDKPVLYRGQLAISLDRARKGILYKYLLVKKGKSYWEDLSDFSTFFGNVNRALKIPERAIKPGGKWAKKSLKVFRFIGRGSLNELKYIIINFRL